MKTLARPRDKAEIVRRLKELRPENVRRWGRMSVHQMVCHLNDSFRLMIGEKTASDATGLVQRTFMKWFALYLPVNWPRGIPTRPEIDQEVEGTRPDIFATDVAQLESLLEFITASTVDSTDNRIQSSAECLTRRGCVGATSTRIIIFAKSVGDAEDHDYPSSVGRDSPF